MIQADLALNYQRMPLASMSLDRDLKFRNANDAYCLAVCRDKEKLLGKYVFEAFPDTEDRIKPFLDALRETLKGNVTRVEGQPYKLLLPDGQLEDRIWDLENHPLLSTSGEIIGLVQYCKDVTEQEALRRERDLITAELMHRVRNTMSVVQSVSDLTIEASESLDDFQKAFSGRLMAMSRNFTMLCEANWLGLDLETILRTELLPYLDSNSERVTVHGDEFTLSVKSTKDASMIFHELVTNALKYGFLSVPDAVLDVGWEFADEHLNVSWEESGVHGVQAPVRDGFGFQMMDMFPNLGLSKTFKPDGIKLTASIPAHIVSGQITFGQVPQK